MPNFAPDVAVEVRSPSDRPDEREWKIGRYLKAGSDLVLDVDPDRRTIEAVFPGGALHFEPGQTLAQPAVRWLTFPVDEAFADLAGL